MAENRQVVFANENSILKNWRKRYQLQMMGILLGCSYLVWCIFHYITFIWVQILFVIMIVLLVYYFIRAYNEDIQSRAEALILRHGTKFLPGLKFYYGNGIDAENLKAQEVIENYNVRECRNVIKGKKFIIEEDWLYSSGIIDFHLTSFEGIIIEVKGVNANNGIKARLVDNKGLTEFENKIDFDCFKYELEKSFRRTMEMFFADRVEVNVYNSRLYVWIKTKEKLFYQFGLTGDNNMVRFVQRIKAIEQLVENIVRNSRN